MKKDSKRTTKAEEIYNEELKAKKKEKKPKDLYGMSLDLGVFTPKQIKQKFEEYDTPFNLIGVLMVYAAILLLNVAFFFLFRMEWYFLILMLVVATIMTPILIINYIRERNEQRRFIDANSYMQQFTNGMLLTKRVMGALKETLLTFPKGKMNKVLTNAVNHIEKSNEVRKAEAESLVYIETKYMNPQIHMLHDFSLRVENRGGDFEDEINMMTGIRNKWRARVEKFQSQMMVASVGGVVLYLIMMFVCAFILRMMPENLDVTQNKLIQVSEIIALSGIYGFVLMLLKKKYVAWMKPGKQMSQKDADRYQDYIEKFDNKRDGIIWRIISIIVFVASIALYIPLQSKYMTGFLIIVAIVLFNGAKIKKKVIQNGIKRELKKEFPKWLFDVCLLMQKNNITVSITKSLDTCPPILTRDIKLFLEKLKENPSDAESYLEFLEEYNIPVVKSTMRMLMSLNSGSATDVKIQMHQLIEHNMNLIDAEDESQAEFQTAAITRFYTYPILPCTALMFIYCFTIIIKIFGMMENLI